VLLQHWEDRPLVTDTNTDNHAPRAVALRRKIRVVIKADDAREDTGVTYGLRSVDLHLDGQVDDGVRCTAHDVDGEALQKLKENGFDFSKPGLVEFTVDFRSWPPHREAMRLLRRDYPSVAVCTVSDEGGFLEFQVYALVSYELVTNTQRHVTELMAPYHGICASWAVLASSPNFG
jgi:Regulator of ribonuclease activity B